MINFAGILLFRSRYLIKVCTAIYVFILNIFRKKSQEKRRKSTPMKIMPTLFFSSTRLDKQLHQLHAGGQGQYFRSLDYLGRSSEAKDRKNPKKVKCDGWTDRRTDGRTDGPTKRVVESSSTRLKTTINNHANTPWLSPPFHNTDQL